MNRLSTFTARCAPLAAALALVACGGGGDASDSDMQKEALRRRVAPVPTQPTSPQPDPAVATSRWQPVLGDTWTWQLSGSINPGYGSAIYDIDLFDTSAAEIAALRTSGKRVVCYFSAGSSENWRPDYAKFSAGDMGNSLSGWAGERWLDTRSANVREVMKLRLDLARSKGCDGVEPDNVDGYTNNPGLPLDANTQLDYNRFLATEGHARGLAVALKNDVDQLSSLAPYFDFAINEQCFQYNECGGYSAFTSLGKPVLNAEYAAKYKDNTAGARDTLCTAARAMGFSTLVLSKQLNDTYRHACS